MFRRIPRALVVSLLIGAAASPLAAQLTPQQTELVSALVEKTLAAKPVPGLSVAIYAGRLPVWTRGWGKADLENDVPATAHTMYRLASVSKPFTATAVMKLVEAGRIDLDAPVQRYLPKFPKKHWPITVRELLCHQSGIRHYRGDDFNNTRHFAGVPQGLELFARDPLQFEPRTRTLYSSYGYNLAGAIVEAVGRRPYAQFVHDEVLVPAGIETMRPDDVYAIIPHRASGYRLRADGVVENCALADTSYKVPSGGWVGTAEDVVRLARAVLRDRILKKETWDQMLEPQRLRDGQVTGYTLGWTVSEEKGLKVYGHSGGQQGTSTHVAFSVEKNLAVAVLMNLEDAPAKKLAVDILTGLAALSPQQSRFD
jgi:CubicO group peptidase (beta-lactamase class C family)